MRHGEKAPTVLVVAHEDVFDNVKAALASSNIALLHARTRDEAVDVLERLNCGLDLAIVELELPKFGALILISQLRRCLPRAVPIIATTSLYPEPMVEETVSQLGVDAVMPKAISPADWRRIVEAALGNNENTPAWASRVSTHAAMVPQPDCRSHNLAHTGEPPKDSLPTLVRRSEHLPEFYDKTLFSGNVHDEPGVNRRAARLVDWSDN